MKENIRQFVRDSLPKFFQRALHVNLTAGDMIQESNRILNGTKVLNLEGLQPLTNKRRNFSCKRGRLVTAEAQCREATYTKGVCGLGYRAGRRAMPMLFRTADPDRSTIAVLFCRPAY